MMTIPTTLNAVSSSFTQTSAQYALVVVSTEKVPVDPAELHQLMFKKNLTSSKDTSAFKKPKRKVDDGSAKRERRRLKRLAKRQKTARYAWRPRL